MMRVCTLVFGFALLAPPAFAAKAGATFKHIVIVIQENRTPDNLFGSNPAFEPGVNIAVRGVTSLHQTVPLTAEPMADCYGPNHDHSDFEAMLTQGADQEMVTELAGCTEPTNPVFKYVDNSTGEVQPYFDIAKGYGFANKMFQTNQGPSFPAHQFLFGGTSQPTALSPLFAADNMNVLHDQAGCAAQPNQTVSVIDGAGSETSNAPIYPCFEHNTLADLLDAASLSWRFYSPTADGIWTAPNAIRHICVPQPSGNHYACTGPAWTDGSMAPTNPPQVLTDIQNCTLAAVSWVVPTALASDHPITTDGSGPQWVASIVNAVGQQPSCASGETYWQDTAVIITWDDWGGWYDHVRPFAVNKQPGSPPAWGDGYTYGFRVPLLVVSAYTPKGLVDNGVHDFGSILYFVEHNFGLGFIGPGGSVYGNYADYQAALRHDDLSAFFGRNKPRVFSPIATAVSPQYFLDLPRSSDPPDSD